MSLPPFQRFLDEHADAMWRLCAASVGRVGLVAGVIALAAGCSTEGGKFPAFSRATRELFFLGGDDRIWIVNYTIQGDTFSATKPRMWSPTQIRRDGTRQNFDISADGKRAVVFPKPAAEEAQGSLHATFLLNFFDEVRCRIP